MDRVVAEILCPLTKGSRLFRSVGNVDIYVNVYVDVETLNLLMGYARLSPCAYLLVVGYIRSADCRVMY